MFTIIGADGKEYGPVSAETIRQWIATGRANAQTQCRREGEAAWSPIGARAEFAVPPTASPASVAAPAATAATATAEALVAAARPFDIGACLSEGWATSKANFFPILGVSILVGLCSAIVSSIPILGLLATLFLTGVFYGGLYFYVLKRKRGQPTNLGEAFSGFSASFGQLALGTFVVSLLTVIAFLCLILPGIYVMVCWAFTYLLIREKGLPFWDAMELGRKVVTAQWFPVFGLGLAVLGIALALLLVPILLLVGGAALLGAGSSLGGGLLLALGGLLALLAALALLPFASCVFVHAYDRLFNPAPSA